MSILSNYIAWPKYQKVSLAIVMLLLLVSIQYFFLLSNTLNEFHLRKDANKALHEKLQLLNKKRLAVEKRLVSIPKRLSSLDNQENEQCLVNLLQSHRLVILNLKQIRSRCFQVVAKGDFNHFLNLLLACSTTSIFNIDGFMLQAQPNIPDLFIYLTMAPT